MCVGGSPVLSMRLIRHESKYTDDNNGTGKLCFHETRRQNGTRPIRRNWGDGDELTWPKDVGDYIFSLRAVSTNIRIPACGVVSATIKAPTVISAVVASSENIGDRAFNERTCHTDRVTLGANLLRRCKAALYIANLLCVNLAVRNQKQQNGHRPT
jgi:hypothetical protein